MVFVLVFSVFQIVHTDAGTRPASSALGRVIFREVKLSGRDDFYSPQSSVEYSYNKSQRDALFLNFI